MTPLKRAAVAICDASKCDYPIERGYCRSCRRLAGLVLVAIRHQSLLTAACEAATGSQSGMDRLREVLADIAAGQKDASNDRP